MYVNALLIMGVWASLKAIGISLDLLGYPDASIRINFFTFDGNLAVKSQAILPPSEFPARIHFLIFNVSKNDFMKLT